MTARSAGSDHEQRVESLLDTWRDWGLDLSGRPRIEEAVEGGRTNRNVRLDAPGLDEDLLLRVNHPDPESLGIERAREKAILDITARAGLTRPYRHWDRQQRFVVFPWLEGRSWTEADLDEPAQRDRLWPLLERLHAIEAGGSRRSYHRYALDYWRQLERAGAVDPALERDWLAIEPALRAFDEADWDARLVHHDLIPDNILDTGERLYLIDWEYAAPGHPDIDVWTLDPEAIDEPFVAEMMEWINELWERLRSL